MNTAESEFQTFLKKKDEKLQAILMGCRHLSMECEDLEAKYIAIHASATSRHAKKLEEITYRRSERIKYLQIEEEQSNALVQETDNEAEAAVRQLSEHESDCKRRLSDVILRIQRNEAELEKLTFDVNEAEANVKLSNGKLEKLRNSLAVANSNREQFLKLSIIQSQKIDNDVADSEEQLRLCQEMVELERQSGGGAMKVDFKAIAAKKRIQLEDETRKVIDAAQAAQADASVEYEEGMASLIQREESSRTDMLVTEEGAEMDLEKSSFEIAEHRRRASEALASQLISVEQASKAAADKYENDMRQLGSQLERDYRSLMSKEAAECSQLEQRRDEAMRAALKWLAQHKRSIEDSSAAAKYQRDAVKRRIHQELKDIESNLGKATLIKEKLTEEIDNLQKSKLGSERIRATDLATIAEYESKELAALNEDEAELVGEPTLHKLLTEIEPAMTYTALTEVGRRSELISTVLDARGMSRIKDYGLESHANTLSATLRAIVRMEATNRDRLASSVEASTKPSTTTVQSDVNPIDPNSFDDLKHAVDKASNDSLADEQWRTARMTAILNLHEKQMEGLKVKQTIDFYSESSSLFFFLLNTIINS